MTPFTVATIFGRGSKRSGFKNAQVSTRSGFKTLWFQIAQVSKRSGFKNAQVSKRSGFKTLRLLQHYGLLKRHKLYSCVFI
jgi:hypothetical protein